MKNIFLFYLLCFELYGNAQVGINTTSPHSSAILDVSSSLKGLLLPRMTFDQMKAITTPSEALLIFNLTSGCIQFYKNGIWSPCVRQASPNIILNCGTMIIKGSYTSGSALLNSNTITLNVNVSMPINYIATTNNLNGYSFFGSGTLSEGDNIINLTGSGTPIALQTDNFTLSFPGTTTTCSAAITVNYPRKNCLAYKNAGFNDDGIYKIDTDGVAGPIASFDCYCDMTNDGGGWTLVFAHNSTGGVFFANDAEADNFPGLPDITSPKYSILNKIDAIKTGTPYEFRLNYPNLSSTNVWSQTFDPRSGPSPNLNPTYITPNVSPYARCVPGYIPISISMNENCWGGLENNSTNTFLDGTAGNDSWWYSIGTQNNSYPGGNPAQNSGTSRVLLFIK